MKFNKRYDDLMEGVDNKRDTAFAKMASTQRDGDAERFGAFSTKYEPLLTGLYANSLEHIGDLTHRLGEHFSDFKGSYAVPKIKSQYRALSNDYPYEKDVVEQVIGNLRYYKKKGEEGYGDMSDEEALERVKSHGRKYAEEHRKVPVYNELQWYARQAAISLGEWNFGETEKCLKWLYDRVEDGTFEERASEYDGAEYSV